MEASHYFEGRFERESKLEKSEAYQEVELSPEKVEQFQEVELILGKIIETGPSMDPAKLNALRQTLLSLLGKLGINTNNDIFDTNDYIDLANRIHNEISRPKPPKNYPPFQKFQQAFERVASRQDLSSLSSRWGKGQLDRYLYSLGIAVGNKKTYENVFEGDPIRVKRGEVVNGRHRKLVLDVLGECGYTPAAFWDWTYPIVEK